MVHKPVLGIRHLQLIHTLSKTSRVTDAAEQLGVTPSALSHRIHEAERRLGVELFTRVQKRLRMTPAAELLAQVAERTLAEQARAEEDARRLNRGTRHVVRIAVEHYSSYHWFPIFLHYLRDRLPDIDLQVTAAVAKEPQLALTNRQVDIAIVAGQNSPVSTNSVYLFNDELLFIMAPGHRLADLEYIEGQDIVGEDFITYTKVPEPDREFALFFRPTGCYPNWIETVELPEAIVELVASGLGTSILASWAVQNAIKNKRIVAARVRREGLRIPWYAVLRPEAEEKDPARKVAVLLAAWCNDTDGFHSERAILT